MTNSKTRYLLLIMVLFFSMIMTGCDGKKPEKGYVTVEYITENVISKFETVEYTKYSMTGTLNYLGKESERLPKEINRPNREFVDSPSQYDTKSSSYFLRLPLHITKENWEIYFENGKLNTTLSTRYNLEAKIYQPNAGYLDTIYYYEREGGGFYLKAFGVNKGLKINKPTEIECNAKWNIICEYDENGYLISESFETLNAHKDDDSKTVYGKATYTYHK